jgi:hypothetical protein
MADIHLLTRSDVYSVSLPQHSHLHWRILTMTRTFGNSAAFFRCSWELLRNKQVRPGVTKLDWSEDNITEDGNTH